MRLLTVVCGIVLATLGLQAQSSAPASLIAIRAARLLDVEAGRMVRPGVLVIEGDRIRATNPETLPPGIQMIELGDLTLLPGLIDLHVHLTFDYEGDWLHGPVVETAADETLRGVPNARKTLLAGFTTVRNLGAGSFTDVALMRAVETGRIDGPRIVPAGWALGSTGGHCDVTGFAPGVLETSFREGVGDGPDELVKALRYQSKHGAKAIKICATAGVMSLEATVGARQLSDSELRAIVDEARRQGLTVAAHAHGTDGIIAASRAGVTTIEHGSILDDEAIRTLNEMGTWLVPTIYSWQIPMLPTDPPELKAKNELVKGLAEKSIRSAIAAGVKIAFGTDAGVYPHGDNAREFAVLVRLGMSAAEAIRTATVHAASVLGLTDRGTLTPGRLADVIGVPGDPLSDVSVLEHVTFVMKGGVVFKEPASGR